MQSLTSFLDPLSSAPPVKGAKAKADAKNAENGGNADFSGLLNALGKPSKPNDGDNDALAAAKAAAAEALAQAGKDGTGLPVMVKTGNFLPGGLPAGDADAEGETDGDAASAEVLTGDMLLALANALLGNGPKAGEAAAETDGATDKAQGSSAKPVQPKLTALGENALADAQKQALPGAQAAASDGKAADQQTPAVTLRVAERGGDDKSGAQGNSSAPKLTAEQAAAQQAAPRGDNGQNGAAQGDNGKSDTRHGAAQSFRLAGTELPRDLQQTGFSADPAQSALGTQAQPAMHAAPAAANAPASVDARQDLALIVDRLIAAREAAAPASADLSINHREFGELSLRIDQRHDGRLAVELMARDPDAHRAVAAAVAADRGQFSGSDQSGGNNAQQQGQQARLGNAGREAAAGQGGSNGSNTARQDQPQGRPATQRGGENSNSDRQPRGGIFA